MPYKDINSPESKASQSRRNKRYYEKNKDKIIAYKKEWKKKYYKENRDKWVNKYNAKSSMTRRLRKFGVTEDEYNELLKKQKYKCAICQKHEDELKYTLCVDHNHETGAVRGLLCHGCNLGLGNMVESINSLKRAIKYLERN